MARFTFKLDGVLRQRKHAEQQRQRELAQALNARAHLEQELRRLDASLQDNRRRFGDTALVGRLDIPAIQLHRRYDLVLQRQGVEIIQKIALAQKQVEEAQAHLAEAAKNRKILEKLRERRQALWAANGAARELAQLDEIAIQMTARPIEAPEADSPVAVAEVFP